MMVDFSQNAEAITSGANLSYWQLVRRRFVHNRYGMIGMLIAVVTTLVTHQIASLPEIVGAIAIGGGIGWFIARKIASA